MCESITSFKAYLAIRSNCRISNVVEGEGARHDEIPLSLNLVVGGNIVHMYPMFAYDPGYLVRTVGPHCVFGVPRIGREFQNRLILMIQQVT